MAGGVETGESESEPEIISTTGLVAKDLSVDNRQCPESCFDAYSHIDGPLTGMSTDCSSHSKKTVPHTALPDVETCSLDHLHCTHNYHKHPKQSQRQLNRLQIYLYHPDTWNMPSRPYITRQRSGRTEPRCSRAV